MVSSRFHISSLAAALIAFAVALRLATATEPGSPVGNWLTESKDGVIEVLRCGTALCGRIVGIGRAPGAPIPTDVQGRSQCGLAILAVESPTARGVWTGSVTDPRNGSTYGAQLWLDHEDKLHIRGYLGIPLLGQTQTWTRYTGRLSQGCRLG